MASPRHNIYLDSHASTPCDPRVVDAMVPFLLEGYANASSPHRGAEHVGQAIQAARETIAQTIGAAPREVVFTAGATESNNLAILGVANAASDRNRVLTSSIEHKSVLEACRALSKRDFRVEIIPVDTQGRVELDALADFLDENVLLVSVQAASNEIGTTQPISEITQLAHSVDALVHCDAAQALGRVGVDVDLWGVDFASFSAHKCYGPKGMGALFVREGPLRSDVEPIMLGGGHEQGLRPGTLNTPGIIGLARACELIQDGLEEEAKRIGMLRDWFESALLSSLPGVRRNGCVNARLAGNSSLTISGVEADVLIANLPEIALSGGSACTSSSIDPSHVLIAIGLTPQQAAETIRIGLGRTTTDADLRYAVERVVEVVTRLRALT